VTASAGMPVTTAQVLAPVVAGSASVGGRARAVSVSMIRDSQAKAVRLVRDHREDYASEFEAIRTVAGRLGMNPETLRKWLRQAAVDAGQVEGTTTAAAREIRELKRKNAELEQTVEILKAATSFFVRESDPRHR
jgi:transposase